MVKQYTVEEAYTDNDKVSRYVDGKLEYYEVMSNWVTEGYCSALESMGYTKAYNVKKAEEILNEAKEAYDYALEYYETAKENALILAN